MHPELEALIQAYDAALQAPPGEADRFKEEFERRLKDVLLRVPRVSEDSLRNVVRLTHRRWLGAQQKPTTLPPEA